MVSALAKVSHDLPLLSLDKTKSVEEVVKFIGRKPSLLMLKLDGLTVKLDYENGILKKASTRGDGNIGEDITHNARTFKNLPLSIPYTNRLVVTGEALILDNDFSKMQETMTGKDGKRYKNSRNLAAGSVRQLDAGECKNKNICFFAFNILEMGGGTVEQQDTKPMELDFNSKFSRLCYLERIGFSVVTKVHMNIKKIKWIYYQH